MQAVHDKAMKPLMELIHANLDYRRIERMMADEKGQVVPEFRFIALEEEFVKCFTNVCEIFKLYGEKRIEEHFDIR